MDVNNTNIIRALLSRHGKNRVNMSLVAKAPWSWGRMYDFCTFFRMGRGIESRSFSLLIVPFSFIRLFDIIRSINLFHVAND